uniref:Uncharacterized protein n=1 Tax=Parascaris univalens TaxID=6257 RepID=A0A915A7U3_PARUN
MSRCSDMLQALMHSLEFPLVAGCKALPFKKFCISVALICLRMRDVRRSIAKELVKIAKIKEQLGENEVTPEVTQDSSQEPSSQSFVPSAVGAPVNESTAILTKVLHTFIVTTFF